MFALCQIWMSNLVYPLPHLAILGKKTQFYIVPFYDTVWVPFDLFLLLASIIFFSLIFAIINDGLVGCVIGVHYQMMMV